MSSKKRKRREENKATLACSLLLAYSSLFRLVRVINRSFLSLSLSLFVASCYSTVFENQEQQSGVKILMLCQCKSTDLGFPSEEFQFLRRCSNHHRQRQGIHSSFTLQFPSFAFLPLIKCTKLLCFRWRLLTAHLLPPPLLYCNLHFPGNYYN